MKNYDFLIIGAGIFGITAAIELRKQKYTVAILNPDTIPHPLAASTDISKIVRMEYGSDILYMDMGNAAIDVWHEWNDFFQETLYHQVGWLLACPEPLDAEVQSFERHSYENLIKMGLQPERLSGDEISKRFPAFQKGKYSEGIFHQKAGFADASKTVQTLAKYARQLGVTIHEGQTAEEFIIEKETVVGLKTREGDQFSANQIIVCAGPFTPHLLPELKPYMRATGHPVFHIKPSRPELFEPSNIPVFSADTSNTGWYGFPLHPREKVVKIANHGIGLELHPEKDERVVTENDIQNLRAFLKDTFPVLANDPIVYTRRCVYADTLDGNFWIDRHPNIEGLTVACGGSGHGFKFGPVLGKLIANTALGKSYLWQERFRWRDMDKHTKVVEEARNLD